MVLIRTALILAFLVMAGGTAFADCRERTSEERTISLKVLKWKTTETGEKWTSFFVETLGVCDPKTGVNNVYMISCHDRQSAPDGCAPVENGKVYPSKFLNDKLTSIMVGNKTYRTPFTVPIRCSLQGAVRWEGVRTAMTDSVRCVSATPVPAVAGGLIGSVWEAKMPDGTFAYVRFEADRKVILADSVQLRRFVRGIWSQTGDKVSLDFLTYFMVTRLEGDLLTGEVITSTGGIRKPWNAKRMKAQ